MTRSRIFNVVLVCSIALNLLFIGAIVGRLTFGPPIGPPPLAWMMKDLNEETRKKIHMNFKDRTKFVAPLRKDIRTAREEVNDLLKEEKLDEEATHAALARLREASGKYSYALHEQMVSMLKDLEPEQRQRVARFLMRPHSRPLSESTDRRSMHRQKPAN